MYTQTLRGWIMTTPMKDNRGRLQLPWKLHTILEDPKYASIIAWTSNGETFRILSKKDFTDIVMPVFFTSTSYKSFQRSLNLWGFRVVSSGNHKGECAHPFFKRGQPDLCMSMKRIKNQGTRKRNPSTCTATEKVSNNHKFDMPYPATTNTMLALRQTGLDVPMPFLPNNVSSPASPRQDNPTLRSLFFGSTTASAVMAPQSHRLAPPIAVSPFLLSAIERELVQAAALVVASHMLASRNSSRNIKE